jgi:hypothetical protein
LAVATSVCICSAIASGGVWAEVKFGIEKLGVVCIYPCPNMLAVVCCGIQKLGAKPSLVVRLWKLFIGWADGFGIKVLLTNVPLVRGLVCTKLTMQEEEEGLRLVASSFFPFRYTIVHRYSLLASLT